MLFIVFTAIVFPAN